MLERAIQLLKDEDLTCVVVGPERIIPSRARGIAPLLTLLEQEPEALAGAAVADRIIGKAAAMLCAAGGVAAVYGEVMSEAGLAMLKAQGIPAEYGTLVKEIRNRTDTGLCPMEQTVLDLEAPEQAAPALRRTLDRLRGKQS